MSLLLLENYSKVTIVFDTLEALKMKQVLSSELLITNLNQEDGNNSWTVLHPPWTSDEKGNIKLLTNIGIKISP